MPSCSLGSWVSGLKADSNDQLSGPVLFSLAGLLFILPLFDGGRSFEARTFFIAVVSILFLVVLLLGKGHHPPPTTYHPGLPLRSFLLLAVFLFLSSLRSAYYDLSLQESLLLLAYFMAFSLASAFVSEKGRLILVSSLALSSLLAAMVAFPIYLFARPGSFKALALMGTFHYPSGLAGFLLLAFYPTFALFLHAEGRKAWLLGLSSALLLFALLLTRSRGGWLLFFLTFLFWAVQERDFLARRRLRAASVGLLVLTLAWASAKGGLATYPHHVATLASGTAASAQDPSFHYRQNIYAWAFESFLDHPLLGTGPGTFPLMLGRYQKIPYISGLYAHNHYLQIASEMGLFGLLLLLALLAWLFWKGFKITNSLPPLSIERSMATSFLTALFASALHAGIDFDWSYPAIALGVVLEAALLVSYGSHPPLSPQPLTPNPQPIRVLAVVLVLSLGVLAFVRFYAEVSLRWGKWAFREGFVNEAEAAFRKASHLYPFSYAAHYWLSLTLAEQGKREEAIQEAEAALRLNPEDGDAYYHVGRMYRRMGRLEEAEWALARAVKLEPSSNLRFYVDLGELLLARGRAEEALRFFQQAVEVFRPELVVSQNGRCLAPGDRYLLAGVLERLSQPPHPLPLTPYASKKLAEKLREPDRRGICREGLKAGLTSPEATILTYWKAAREGKSQDLRPENRDLIVSSLRSRVSSLKFPPWAKDASFLRIVELSAGETEAWVIYEVTVGGKRLRLQDRLKLEEDGWRFANPHPSPH